MPPNETVPGSKLAKGQHLFHCITLQFGVPLMITMAMVITVLTMITMMMLVPTETGQGEINTGESGDEINANDGRDTSFLASCHS